MGTPGPDDFGGSDFPDGFESGWVRRRRDDLPSAPVARHAYRIGVDTDPRWPRYGIPRPRADFYVVADIGLREARVVSAIALLGAVAAWQRFVGGVGPRPDVCEHMAPPAICRYCRHYAELPVHVSSIPGEPIPVCACGRDAPRWGKWCGKCAPGVRCGLGTGPGGKPCNRVAGHPEDLPGRPCPPSDDSEQQR